MAPDDEKSLAIVLYRLEEIEKRRAEDRRHFEDIVGELKADMRSQISAIAYVRQDTFNDYKLAQEKEHSQSREAASDARKIALAALWVLIVAVASGIIALAFQVATS